MTKRLGGIDFVDCVVEDDRDRPVVLMQPADGEHGLFDVTGIITVRNPHDARMDLGQKRDGVTLQLDPSGW